MNLSCLVRNKKFILLLTLMLSSLYAPCRLEAVELITKGETFSLNKLLEIAVKKHPQITSAQNTVDVVKSRVGQAKAGYYPQLNLSAGMSRNASPLLSDQFNQYQSNLSLNQNIYDFNRVGTKVDIQTLDLGAARANLDNVTNNIILGVKQAYYERLRAKHIMDIRADTIKQFEEQLARAKGYYEVGVKPVFDVTTAEVNLGNAKVNLVTAQNALTIAVVNLNNAIGMPAAPPYELEDDVTYQKTSLDLEESLKQAFLNRPDLQSLVRQKEAAQKAVTLAQKDYMPTVLGNASYGWSGQDMPLDRGWSVGVNLNLNLFSGFLTKNQVSEALAALEVSRAAEESLRQTIRLDVEQALANLRAAEESIVTAEVTVRQATENLDLARGRYAAGVGTPLELTDAVVALGNARLVLSGAMYDRKEAAASLQRAVGEK